MKFECKVKAKYNYRKINSIIQKLPQVQNKVIKEILKNIQEYAIKFERGHNSDGILIEIIDTSTKETKGRTYAEPSKFTTENGQSYLWFEYFGTGEHAEKEHIGKTKHFIESGYTEWYIPVNKVGRNLSYPIVTFNNKQFYVAVGSKANHFLGDAEFKSRAENIEIARRIIEEMIKEACK